MFLKKQYGRKDIADLLQPEFFSLDSHPLDSHPLAWVYTFSFLAEMWLRKTDQRRFKINPVGTARPLDVL